ncbi:axin interactor, dorsalization-associated protein-like [Salvelinus alpinus]|uniref:axin interactor, dorsalization-associated protein-like n=1 Tax=Salvelinus alpinus TaxID=8036 RepID=UPI0039FD38E3
MRSISFQGTRARSISKRPCSQKCFQERFEAAMRVWPFDRGPSWRIQCTQSQEEFKLEDLKKREIIINSILTYNKDFPFDVQPVPLRRILAPGEEENLEVEEEEDAATGAGSPESFPNRVPGTLLPRLPSEPRMSLLTIKIDKIGLKDAGQCIDPYMTVSVKDFSGIDLNPVQDTPVATRKEDTYIHFSVDIEIQRHIETTKR